jgi:hypothetical protein
VRPRDSWDTHSRFTYYGLTGLSRHADHHAHPRRPFQQLRVFEEAPILPTGYVGMVDMVMVKNDEFIEHAVAELRRRELGPFAADASPEERDRLERFERARAAAENGAGASVGARAAGLRGLWQRVPEKLRPWLFWGAAVLVFTLGARLEADWIGAAIPALAPTLLRNLVILGVFAGTFYMQSVISKRTGRDGFAWLVAFAALLVVGSISDPWLY